ncbi:MAG TPA: hypothetical protein VIK72_19615 [Clostridiaceae bacterium]
MKKYIDAIEKLRNEMLQEKEKLEEKGLYESEKFMTIESVFCKLCELEVALNVGVTKMESLEDIEIEQLVYDLLNKDLLQL